MVRPVHLNVKEMVRTSSYAFAALILLVVVILAFRSNSAAFLGFISPLSISSTDLAGLEQEKETLTLRLQKIDAAIVNLRSSSLASKPPAYVESATSSPEKSSAAVIVAPKKKSKSSSPFLLRELPDGNGDGEAVQPKSNSILNAQRDSKLISTKSSTSSSSSSSSSSSLSTAPVPAVMSTASASLPAVAKSSGPSSCKYSIKVYVYPLPSTLPAVRLGEEARANKTLHVCQKCILEQFSLEYIVNDFFTQFCGRTFDPSEADFFYLPLLRDAEYRLTMEDKGPRKRAPSATEQALIDVIEKGNFVRWLQVFNVPDKYWRAKGGADHIIVMPAPVTNLRHESSKRGFFHYMIHLYPPIFLGVEYSASFIREYPVCATQKNIVLPYPTTDPDLFNGQLLREEVPRTALIYYAGGVHGDCVEIRKAMKQVLQNSTRLQGVVPDIKSIQAEREHGFRAATFCPIPVGDSPSSKRMYDVLHFGCIPVVLSDDLVWAFDYSTGGSLNRSQFSIQMPQSVVQFSAETLLKRFQSRQEAFGYLPGGESIYGILERANREGAAYQNGVYVNPLVQILQRVSRDNIAFLQQGVAKHAPAFRFYALNSSMVSIPTATRVLPDGGAIDEMVNMLAERKRVGTVALRDKCMAEKKQPGHSYLSRYPCEPNERRRLLQEYFVR